MDLFDTYDLFSFFTIEELSIGYKAVLNQVDYSNIPCILYLLMSIYTELSKKVLVNDKGDPIKVNILTYQDLTDDVITILADKIPKNLQASDLIEKITYFSDTGIRIAHLRIYDIISTVSEEMRTRAAYWSSSIDVLIRKSSRIDYPSEYPNDTMKAKFLWLDSYISFFARNQDFIEGLGEVLKLYEASKVRINEVVELFIMVGLYHFRNREYTQVIETQNILLTRVDEKIKHGHIDPYSHLHPNYEHKCLLIKSYMLLGMAYYKKFDKKKATDFFWKAFDLQHRILPEGKVRNTYMELDPSNPENFGINAQNLFKIHFGDDLDNYSSKIDPREFIPARRFEYAILFFFEFFSKLKHKFGKCTIAEVKAVKRDLNKKLNEDIPLLGHDLLIPTNLQEIKNYDYKLLDPNEINPPKVQMPDQSIPELETVPQYFFEDIELYLKIEQNEKNPHALHRKSMRYLTKSRKKQDISLTSMITRLENDLVDKLEYFDDYDLEICKHYELLSLAHMLNHNFDESMRYMRKSLRLKSACSEKVEEVSLIRHHILEAMLLNLEGDTELAINSLKKSQKIAYEDLDMDPHFEIMLHQMLSFVEMQAKIFFEKNVVQSYVLSRLKINNSKADNVLIYEKIVEIFELPDDFDFMKARDLMMDAINSSHDFEFKGSAFDIMGFLTYKYDKQLALECHIDALNYKPKNSKGHLLFSYEKIITLSDDKDQILLFMEKIRGIWGEDEIAIAVEDLRLSVFAFEHEMISLGFDKFQRASKAIIEMGQTALIFKTLVKIFSYGFFKFSFQYNTLKGLTSEQTKNPVKNYAFLVDILKLLEMRSIESILQESNDYFNDLQSTPAFMLEKDFYAQMIKTRLHLVEMDPDMIVNALTKRIDACKNCWQLVVLYRFIGEAFLDVSDFDMSYKYYKKLEEVLIELVGKKEKEVKLLQEFLEFWNKKSKKGLTILKKDSKFVDAPKDSFGISIDPKQKYVNVRLDLDKYFEEANYWKLKMKDIDLLPEKHKKFKAIEVKPKAKKEGMMLDDNTLYTTTDIVTEPSSKATPRHNRKRTCLF